MSRVRGRGNERTEIALMRIFRRHKIIGWRRNQKLFGHPDFVFREQRLAIFVDGCFWHGCPKHGSYPAIHRAFWIRKLGRNRERDKLVNKVLAKQGWKVLRIWEHDLVRKRECMTVCRIRRQLVS